jgi:hypothetical protein
VELLHRHIHLAVIHKVQHGLELREADVFEMNVRAGVGAVPEDAPLEQWAGGEDDPVRLDLLEAGAHRQGHVQEILVLPQLLECLRDVWLEVVPPNTQVLGFGHFGGS